MTKATNNEVKDQVTANGTSTDKAAAKGIESKAAAIDDGVLNDAPTSIVKAQRYELPKSTVVRKTTTERPIRITSKYYEQLLILTDGVPSKPESLDSFLDFVASDRLRRVPHRGSRWDKILRWAEYFAIQISILHESVGTFVPNSTESAQLIWQSCQILLQMGPQHSDALDKIFGVLYKMSLPLTSILRNSSLFAEDDDTQEQLVTACTELLTIVVDITLTYQRRSRSKYSSNADDLYRLYGRRIDTFFQQRDHVSNAIWKCRLEREVDSRSIAVDVTTVRGWLAPHDRTLQLLTTDTMNSRSARVEFTCEWFQSHLLEFTRGSDDILFISGASGSGKSILSGWIVERLQRVVGRKSFDVDSVIIGLCNDSAIESEATPIRIIKRLLLQSLEHNVGNASLFKLLGAAYKLSNQATSPTDIENALWRAFDKALDVGNDIMIVVDGLDQIIGGEPVIQKFVDRLYQITVKHRTTKCIILSHPRTPPSSERTRQFSLQPKYVRDDLRLFIDRSLGPIRHFQDQQEGEKEAVVHRIIDCAQGSFVLAKYTIELLSREETHEGFTKTLSNAPTSISQAIQLLVSQLDLSNSHTKRVLSWLLVSERPLTLKEIQLLLEIDITNHKRSNKTINVEEQLRRTCGPLIEIRDGVVSFRHVTIHQHLLELSKAGKTLLSLHDAHCDLTYRCLVYTNTQVAKRSECRMNVLDSTTIDAMFETHQLLEYTTRYWTTHFRRSPMYRTNGKHEYTSEFRRCFAPSVFLAQIEGSCWESQSSTIEAIEMHRFALNIRKDLFTDCSEVVLQSLITIARTYERISRAIEASEFFYHACKLSQTILGIHSTLTTSCAEAYVTSTKTITSTTRTEVTNRKEEMLKAVITSLKHYHGSSSAETIKYSKLLAQLYTDIQEIPLAIQTYREVYEACIECYGEFHPETVSISRDLTVCFQGESRYEDVLVYLRRLYEKAEETMDVIDVRFVKITLRLVEINEVRKDFTEAEELIVTLWRRIALACHHHRSLESHERKIEITLAYVKFLRRQSRYVEAESLLRGLWIEYEREDIESESLIIWIKAIGEELNELRILDVAVSVFRAVWAFFKRTHRQHTVEAASVAIYIAEITAEIRSQEETYTETTSTEETILKEVHQRTLTTISTTKVTTSIVQTCEILSSYYVRNKRWSEAISICEGVLKSIWSSFGTNQGDIKVCKGFAVEGIDMAVRVGHCHWEKRQIEKSEHIFKRVFHATKSSLLIQDELVSRCAKELILFYESTNRSAKTIEVHQELYEEYSYTLGKTHPLTLEVLYRLGGLCLRHGRKEAQDYYLHIYTDLGHDSDICHPGAIEAALALTRIYDSEKRWTAAQTIYSCLWKTVLARTEEYNIQAVRVEEIYRRHSYVLEEVKVDYAVLRQTTVEFREVCFKAFGARADISIKSTLRLAEINERSEQHLREAIEIYEETFKEVSTVATTTTTTTTITDTIHAAKSRLTRLYITHSTTSTEYISKAVTLCLERYESSKTQYGCSHETTLTSLEDLTGFYKSRNDQKLQTIALKLLQDTIIEIVIKEKDSKRLFDSSNRLARIYLAHGYRDEAQELLLELRRQIICRDTRFSSTCGFEIDQLVDRRSYVFLATFEEVLEGTKTVCFSEIMADFLLETILQETYTKSLTKEIGFETTFVHGARLRYFRRSKYSSQDSKIEEELFEAFRKQVGSSITTSETTTRYFFSLLIEDAGKSHREVHLVKSGCSSGTVAVHCLLEQSKFQEAINLSTCIRQFTTSHHGYRDQENINTGFKLALYLAGRNAKKCQDQKIRQQMLALSRSFLEEILEASRQIKVDLTKTPILELNELISLLGEVGDYNNLEWVLTQLWESRDKQHTWTPTNTIWIGRRLVEVKFSHGSHFAAIRLLEDICYNLRRVWGPLDPTTLEMETLRSQMYTSMGSHAKAMHVHEEILQHICNDDDDVAQVDLRAAQVCTHLDHLKRCHARLGGWGGKDAEVYTKLYDELVSMFRGQSGWREIQPISKWPKRLSGDDHHQQQQHGTFKQPATWEIIDVKKSSGGSTNGTKAVQHQNWLRRVNGLQRWDSEAKRATLSPGGIHLYH